MTWRLAKSLDTLRAQINAAAPKRSKASDGTIGDAAHASRTSDHNPWISDGVARIVSAVDITHDPANGVDIQRLADRLVASQDPRIKYIICNGRIVSGTGQAQPAWTWRAYTGANKHSRHIHISVKATKAQYDDTRPWQLGAVGDPVQPAAAVLKRGASGPFVAELQANLAALGFDVGVDGAYGAKTEAAIRAFQQGRGLAVDGWTGPRTIDAIGKALAERDARPKLAKAEQSVPPTADTAVKQEAGWFGKLGGWLTGAGAVGVGAAGQVFGAEWSTILAVAGAVVVVGLIGVVGFLVLGSRVAAKFDEINRRAG